jgi:hypothetical protein
MLRAVDGEGRRHADQDGQHQGTDQGEALL